MESVIRHVEDCKGLRAVRYPTRESLDLQLNQ